MFHKSTEYTKPAGEAQTSSAGFVQNVAFYLHILLIPKVTDIA